MPGLILASLIWLVTIPVATWGIIALSLLVSGYLSTFTNKDEPGVGRVAIGFFTGWVLAVTYWVFAGYHIVTNLIEIIRLI